MSDHTQDVDPSTETAKLRGGRDNHLILATATIIGSACVTAIWAAAHVFNNVSGLHPGLLDHLMTVINTLCAVALSAAGGLLFYNLACAAVLHHELRTARRTLRSQVDAMPDHTLGGSRD
jgi:hypothetical protein